MVGDAVCPGSHREPSGLSEPPGGQRCGPGSALLYSFGCVVQRLKPCGTVFAAYRFINKPLTSMKISLIPITLITVFGLFSCEKHTDNPGVDKYIDELISGTYESYDLPDFNTADISALLEYRNETTTITNFPHNPISSFWQPECKLGMLVLWTVESIRAVENKSEYLIGRFPSQNPALALRDTPELSLVFDDQSHKEAAKAYYDWWNSFQQIKDKVKIDPLVKTNYRWH